MIQKHGLSVAIVFQHNSSSPRTYLTPGRGTTDAIRSLELAKQFGQPQGTAIYFGTDGADVNFFEGKGGKQPAGDRYGLRLISDYFTQIKAKLDASGYDVGVYGSGLVCDTLMTKNLVKYCWLANATKWPGTEDFYASKRWSLTQFLPKYCGGKELDFDQVNPDKPNFGQWNP